MKLWKKLEINDIVDVVAPGSSTSAEELEQACNFLKSWGLRPRVSKSLFSGHPYLANSDEFRFADLKKALLAKDSKMVWCLRGGYGSLRLIPALLKLKTPAKNKLFIGYSDITSLHLFLQQKWNWISCHGPLLDGLGRGKYPEAEVHDLRSILFGEAKAVRHTGLVAMNTSAEKKKKISAPLVGGNLVTLSSHWGTALNPKLTGKILFLEEIGERAYRLDRLLTQLSQNSVQMKAIVIGEFIGGAESTGQNFGAQTVMAWAKSLKVPVYRGLACGHGESNRPLFMGAKAELAKTINGFELSQKSGVF